MKIKKLKKTTSRSITILILWLFILFISQSCIFNIGTSMPEEILGVWETSGDYVNQFTFTRNNLAVAGWSKDWPGEFDYDYNTDLSEVFESDNMIYTDIDIYWTYHLSSSTSMYLHKTNPGNEKPDLPSSWWTDSSIGKYTLYKK